jgi:hypothetical protein
VFEWENFPAIKVLGFVGRVINFIFIYTMLKDEVIGFEKLKAISQIAPIKERIRFFESKYGCTFGEFKEKIKGEKEDFEKWDDYIEWKA